MRAKCLDELVAYQFAVEFKDEVFKLLNASQAAQRDHRFFSQLSKAASGVTGSIAEGFHRFLPGEFAQFLRYALASLAEAEIRINDGIALKYFAATDCTMAFTWARRCRGATRNLHASQRRTIAKRNQTSPPQRRRSTSHFLGFCDGEV
jgi:four helix bundle protein